MGGLVSERPFSGFMTLGPAMTVFRVIVTAFGFANGEQKCLDVFVLQILFVLGPSFLFFCELYSMHWIQVLIGPTEALIEARGKLPSAVVCPLRQGFALIPLTQEVEAELRERATNDAQEVLPVSGEMAQGAAELASALSSNAPIVYAATFIHGGTGGQDAIVWLKGEVVLNVGDDEENMSAWPDSPISRALRRIGVTAETGEDEFDALGLGCYRSNESWAEAHHLKTYSLV
ncbi:hypothetical protein ACQKQA_00415 [Pseudomonas sp. NPDC089530]|uniref:hypothetical protein n=1 Tax=Pseudomonas sp. NPDC089530 TaxID=3390651 RepID=UPI003D0255E2